MFSRVSFFYWFSFFRYWIRLLFSGVSFFYWFPGLVFLRVGYFLFCFNWMFRYGTSTGYLDSYCFLLHKDATTAAAVFYFSFDETILPVNEP